jgi:hypothetical protein
MSRNLQRITGLSQVELNLLAERLAGKRKDVSHADTIPRRSESASRLPASYAQERMWLLNQFAPDSPAFNISIAMRLAGKLNVGAVSRSINEMVRRHEILRTSFSSPDGQLFQVIDSDLTLLAPLIDLQGLTRDEKGEEIRRVVAREAAHVFDLSRCPLLRVVLVRLEPQEHVLVFTMHHIISDGWSMRVLVSEMCALYSAFSEGKPSPLADLPIQYADFAIWQRQTLQGEALEKTVSYWKRRLGGVAGELSLPADRPRPALNSFRGKVLPFSLSAALSKSINSLSLQEGATLFMTLLSAFKVLLHYYSGQDDIVVGTNIANRNRREVEGLIGFFVNNLAIRTVVADGLTFRQLLGRVREVTLEAYAHQDIPFDMLVEALQVRRAANSAPLFQVMFILQNVPMRQMTLPGLKLDALEVAGVVSKFDLTLFMQETERGLDGWVEYSSDLFDEATISRMTNHFLMLLEQIANDPDRDLGSYSISAPTEKQEVLAAFNDVLE